MAKLQLLVVEDDPFMKPILPRILYSLAPDLDLFWVDNVADAKSVLSNEKFDLVITDHMLPGSERGAELCIHCEKAFPDMPVLLISGLALKSVEKDSGVTLKSTHYLEKPIRFAECKKLVADLMHFPIPGARG